MRPTWATSLPLANYCLATSCHRQDAVYISLFSCVQHGDITWTFHHWYPDQFRDFTFFPISPATLSSSSIPDQTCLTMSLLSAIVVYRVAPKRVYDRWDSGAIIWITKTRSIWKRLRMQSIFASSKTRFLDHCRRPCVAVGPTVPNASALSAKSYIYSVWCDFVLLLDVSLGSFAPRNYNRSFLYGLWAHVFTALAY